MPALPKSKVKLRYRVQCLLVISTGMFKKSPRKVVPERMKLILPDGSFRLLDQEPSTVEVILQQEGVNPAEVMVTRDGKLITEDTLVRGDDELRIIRISHGG